MALESNPESLYKDPVEDTQDSKGRYDDEDSGQPKEFSHVLSASDFLSTQIIRDVLSSFTYIEQHRLLDFCLFLNVISKEFYSHLLKLFRLDCVSTSENYESFHRNMKLWSTTESIKQELQLAVQSLEDKITDALLIIFSFCVSADLIQPLAKCLCCSVPEFNVSVTPQSIALQILWDWREKEKLYAKCDTLVKALFSSETFPIDVTKLIISYIESEHIKSEHSKSEHQKQLSVTLGSSNSQDEPLIKEMRLSFAQAYIRMFEGIKKKCIAEWLKVPSDANIHEFILKRCSWINYDLLEELDDDLGNGKAFGAYVKQFKSTLEKLRVFQISPNSIPAVQIPEHCIFSIDCRLFHSSMHAGSVLYKIKSTLSEKLNTKVAHFLISGIDEKRQCIYISIQNKEVLHYLTENLDALVRDSFDNDYSYALSIEASEASEIGHKEKEMSFVVPPLSAYPHQDETKFSNAVHDVDIVGDVLLDFSKGPKLEISMTEFKRIILNHKVPVALCLVAVMGLPDCFKTSILQKLFRENIKLKENAKQKLDDYMTRKEDRNGLSIYELCVLGGKPYNQYSWSFTTDRFGSIFSILCGLVRHIALAKSEIGNAEFTSDGHVSDSTNSLVDDHFKWLMGKVEKQLKDISMDEKKEALLLNGLTLANIIDVGVNKALYDFLPIMLSFCHSHLRLVFFSLERDSPKLNEVPDLSADHYSRRGDNHLIMTRRPRINYILHFATLGHDQKQKESDCKKTLIIATSKNAIDSPPQFNEVDLNSKIQEEAKKQNVEKFVSNVIHVSINDENSLTIAKDKITEFIIKDKTFQKSLPLSFIFLRSLIISAKKEEAKAMILKRSDIYDLAKKIDMDEEEFENFLVTFTDFGSILYMPQFKSLRDIIVVDIWQFMQFLNELFYPQEGKKWYSELTTYGVIRKAHAFKILKHDVENFMKIIITFGIAALISKGKYDHGTSSEECYYLPSARIHKKSPPSDFKNDYAFLKFESVNFPANVQASISHELMKKQNFRLIGNKCFDISEFEFQASNGHLIRIRMVYEGTKTKLIFHINDTCASAEKHHCVSACKSVIEACCDSLNRKTNQIRDLKYFIGVPCSAHDSNSHYIYFNDASELCRHCKDALSFSRDCWIDAAKMCNKLRKNEDNNLSFEELLHILQEVAKNNMLSEFKNELNKVGVHKTTKSYQEDRQVIEVLMMWETKQHSPRYSLIKILNRLQLYSIADMIKLD